MNKFFTLALLIALAPLAFLAPAQAATSTTAAIQVSAFVVPTCSVSAASTRVAASCTHQDVSFTVRQMRSFSSDAATAAPTLSSPGATVVLTVVTY